MSTKKPKGRCIVPGCKNEVKWCGNCCKCYFEGRRAIKAGEITEAELIKRKLRLPSRPGRKAKSAMSRMIRK